MKKYMFWIALAAFVLPTIARGLWFYRGIPTRPNIATPDYAALKIQEPPFETSAVNEDENIKLMPGVVLFDAAHSNQYQMSEINALKEAIEKRGGKVESFNDASMLARKLKYASAYVVISPSIPFSDDEAQTVASFVRRGGRLIVFTDATRGFIYTDYFSGAITNYSDAGAVNPLLAPHGITINSDYLYNLEQNDSNFRNVVFEDFGKHELTFGLKQAALYGAHSLLTTSGTILFASAESTLSSIDDAHHPKSGGAILSADENVLALGDFTFLTSPYKNAFDNFIFIENIADFTLDGKRALTLENFPFLFAGNNAQIYATSEVTLTAEMISSIGKLQTSLAATNTTLELAGEAPRNGDMIVLGTFTASDDLQPFIKSFNINFDEGEFISVPKVGKIGRYGNALFLFEQTKTGNRLVLLTDTPDDLASLLDTIANGSLDSCVIQDNLAICGISFGGYYEGDGAAIEEGGEGETTPTPVGEG